MILRGLLLLLLALAPVKAQHADEDSDVQAGPHPCKSASGCGQDEGLTGSAERDVGLILRFLGACSRDPGGCVRPQPPLPTQPPQPEDAPRTTTPPAPQGRTHILCEGLNCDGEDSASKVDSIVKFLGACRDPRGCSGGAPPGQPTVTTTMAPGEADVKTGVHIVCQGGKCGKEESMGAEVMNILKFLGACQSNEDCVQKYPHHTTKPPPTTTVKIDSHILCKGSNDCGKEIEDDDTSQQVRQILKFIGACENPHGCRNKRYLNNRRRFQINRRKTRSDRDFFVAKRDCQGPCSSSQYNPASKRALVSERLKNTAAYKKGTRTFSSVNNYGSSDGSSSYGSAGNPYVSSEKKYSHNSGHGSSYYSDNESSNTKTFIGTSCRKAPGLNNPNCWERVPVAKSPYEGRAKTNNKQRQWYSPKTKSPYTTSSTSTTDPSTSTSSTSTTEESTSTSTTDESTSTSSTSTTEESTSNSSTSTTDPSTSTSSTSTTDPSTSTSSTSTTDPSTSTSSTSTTDPSTSTSSTSTTDPSTSTSSTSTTDPSTSTSSTSTTDPSTSTSSTSTTDPSTSTSSTSTTEESTSTSSTSTTDPSTSTSSTSTTEESTSTSSTSTTDPSTSTSSTSTTGPSTSTSSTSTTEESTSTSSTSTTEKSTSTSSTSTTESSTSTSSTSTTESSTSTS